MNAEQLTRLGEERLVHRDLFSFSNIVVPCKTKGMWFGSISKGAGARGIPIPVLTLCESKVVAHEGKNYVFVALWNESIEYSEKHIFECACSALLAAAHAHLRELAVPLLGGNQGRRFIGTMEKAVLHIEDALEPTGLALPEVTFVTR